MKRYMVQVEVKGVEQFPRADDVYIEQELAGILDGSEIEDPDGEGWMVVSVSATTALS